MKRLLKTTIYSFLFITICISQTIAQDSTKATSWFTVTKISDNVWKIDDNGSDNMYLVEGNKKALLIDTGIGAGDLLKCVNSITNKPTIVVNTHGHPDHAGGNFQFDTVYAASADFELATFFTSDDYRNGSIKDIEKNNPDKAHLILKDTEQYPETKLININDGHIFDLGGRKFEVVSVPGHTPGQLCLLDSENKIIFTGDNNNDLVWLFLDHSLPLSVYQKSLKKLYSRKNEFDTVYPGHAGPWDNELINELIICVDNILEGKCEPEEYNSFIGKAKLCKYKRASVAYDENNLREK